jgi:hypothetical protein
MTEAKRVPLTIRLNAEDKEVFVAAAQSSGFEPAIAARHVIELLIRGLKENEDFLEMLMCIKNAVKAPTKSPSDC